mmetsp:Transcript_7372/g.13983  ORF Transcript_7372/g.13983 Transcript_7372/m.13983 type:complete len:413 (-) Transcript_7372:92-1330(-)
MYLSKSIQCWYFVSILMQKPFYSHSQRFYATSIRGHQTRKRGCSTNRHPQQYRQRLANLAQACSFSTNNVIPTFVLINQGIMVPMASNRITSKHTSKNYNSGNKNGVFTTIATYATKSSFVPPEPPSFQGQSVFPNINLTEISDDALIRNEDRNAIFVVTGASRGIGLQIVKDLIERTKGTIIACCRDPVSAKNLELFKLSLPQETSMRISIQKLDLEDQSSIEHLAESIKSSYNRVDVLCNVAGILGDGGATTPGPERSLRSMNREWALKSFNVNYMGPIFLSQACAPMMKKKRNDKNDGSTCVIACLSARVGSISDNGLGGWISYRASKAALNQGIRTIAHELKRQGTLAITLHPGTTDTDLSKPFQKNVKEDRLFPVDFTSGRLIDAVDCMKEEHTGGFYDWSGTALPF